MRLRPRALGMCVIGVAAFFASHVPLVPRARPSDRARSGSSLGEDSSENARAACEGDRGPLPEALFFELESGAFPGSGHPDVAVHVPPGFDASRRPGAVVYFHGWNGCVAQALSADDAPCSEDDEPRSGAALASQVDDARVNALVVAVELRVDMATGEPGALAAPGGLRALLHEVLSDKLAPHLGCPIEVDALDRVVVVAHSGGYQAAAGVLAAGDVPSITEVDLLDALYGADDVFRDWMGDQAARFDPRVDASLRFVDLYTAHGGTLERSRAMARFAADALSEAGLDDVVRDDDSEDDLDDEDLAHAVVLKRVPLAHGDLPRAYVRAIVSAAGFAHID